MFKWLTVYIKYTHLSLSYWLGVFQVYNRWCVCMEEGWRNPCRYVRLDIISAEFKKEENSIYLRNLRQITTV